MSSFYKWPPLLPNRHSVKVFLYFLGLYTVERYWEAVGLSGYKVFKFVMSRMPNQAPPPWVNTEKDENSNSNMSCQEGDSDSSVSR